MNKKLEEVAQAYRQEGSIKGAAQSLGISPSTVLKALCTQGIYPTEQAAAVHRLLAGGWSPEEVQERLEISPKQYDKYMPYTKGSYALTTQKSVNALRVKATREKQKEGK